MQLITLLTPLALLITTALAEATIVDALAAVNGQTLQLQNAVTSWHGDLLGLLPITKQSTDVLLETNKGTRAAKKSAPLDALGALGVAEATVTLTQSVNSSLSPLIAAKPKFDRLKVSPLILVSLGLQKKATEDMSAAILDKVPADLRGVAEGLVAPIAASFELAVDAFHPF
ncbi:hydrophobic surface binding protein A-domain-containing protein [Echria macrotheca]|uniref:Hydrophobic surface binding protein A-domain-containing protein n=1 Tax=Echria macrotheca TaxID=438768 RepID=A0AAJ0BBZ7_9PEZI|nr:hydrophobic surface binding protein A-domain-containing protein [Echria macrotheca]